VRLLDLKEYTQAFSENVSVMMFGNEDVLSICSFHYMLLSLSHKHTAYTKNNLKKIIFVKLKMWEKGVMALLTD